MGEERDEGEEMPPRDGSEEQKRGRDERGDVERVAAPAVGGGLGHT